MFSTSQKLFIYSLMVCYVHGCRNGKPNCTCVTYFQAFSDVLGPDHPRHLGSKVTFKASANWALNLSLGFKAYVKDKLIMSYPKSIYNMSCGSQMSRVFQFVNHRMDKDNPSGYPKVDIVLYADHPDNPDDGAPDCSHYLCRRFQVYYHFPPGPENIDITLDPPNAIQGQQATVTCSSKDGYPQPNFGIRAFSLVYNLELFYSPASKLTMPAAISGTYGCEAITYLFGQRMVVPSDKRVVIARRHEPTTVETSSSTESSKSWEIAMMNEQEEYPSTVDLAWHTGHVGDKLDNRLPVNITDSLSESAMELKRHTARKINYNRSEIAVKSFLMKTNESKIVSFLRPKRQINEDMLNKGSVIWSSCTVELSLLVSSVSAYLYAC